MRPNPVMAGTTVYSRLVHDQDAIRNAPKSEDRKQAYQALKETEAAWEVYNNEPTPEHWEKLQAIGSNLDSALRKMRGEKTGNPGTLPPCITMRESWCRQPGDALKAAR